MDHIVQQISESDRRLILLTAACMKFEANFVRMRSACKRQTGYVR